MGLPLLLPENAIFHFFAKTSDKKIRKVSFLHGLAISAEKAKKEAQHGLSGACCAVVFTGVIRLEDMPRCQITYNLKSDIRLQACWWRRIRLPLTGVW